MSFAISFVREFSAFTAFFASLLSLTVLDHDLVVGLLELDERGVEYSLVGAQAALYLYLVAFISTVTPSGISISQ